MDAIKIKSVIGEDHHLRIDLEVPLPPGPVEVIMIVSPQPEPVPERIAVETVRQRFLAAAGCGASGDPHSSERVDEVLYGKRT